MNTVSVCGWVHDCSLPYRFGDLRYQHRHEDGALTGDVRERPDGPCFTYRAHLNESPFAPCPAGSLDEFLFERYAAPSRSRNRIALLSHLALALMQKEIQVSVSDNGLLQALPWFATAKVIGANYSPGAREVWMGWPHKLNA